MSSHLYAGLTVAAAMLHTVFGNTPDSPETPIEPQAAQVSVGAAWNPPTSPTSEREPVVTNSDPIARQARAGATQIDRSIRELPALGAQIANKVGQQGIAGFLEHDAAYSAQAERVGRGLSQGIGNLVQALATDMTATARQAGR